jgi:hypothetical protein
MSTIDNVAARDESKDRENWYRVRGLSFEKNFSTHCPQFFRAILQSNDGLKGAKGRRRWHNIETILTHTQHDIEKLRPEKT